jgi:hypothetical protein
MLTIPANTDNKWTLWARSRWKAAFGFERHQQETLPATVRPLPKNYAADLRALLDLIGLVSRRAIANNSLSSWMICATWIFAGIVVAAAVSRRLTGVIIGAGALALAAAVVAVARAWSKKPSAYALACRVDAVAGLQDRLSTALYLGGADNQDAMALWQRRDALRRVPEVDGRRLFPIRVPGFAIQTLALALVAAALLTYRTHHRAPILALVQKATSPGVAKAVFSPLGAVKKDLLALVTREPEVQQAAADAETVPGLPDAKNGDDPSQANKDGMTPDGDWDEDSQAGSTGDPGDVGDPQAGDSDAQGQGQDASQAADAPQNQQSADANQQSQGDNAGDRGAAEQQQAGEQQSGANSVLQALKNLMKNMTGQPSSSPGESGGQPSAAGSSQQAGNSPGQGAKSEDSKDSDQKDSGSSPGSKKPGGGAGNGSTPVPKQAPKNGPPPPKNTVPDRVELDANNFRQQGHIRTTSAVGTAQLPLRDIKPQPVAAIKGAEQENIPVRYRLYVQRYFEHTDKTPDKEPEKTSE